MAAKVTEHPRFSVTWLNRLRGTGDISGPDYHTVPHWHERIYNAQNRDGMKINHRTDINTPLEDKW